MPKSEQYKRLVDSDLSNWSIYAPDGKPLIKEGKSVPEPKPKKPPKSKKGKA